MRLSKVVLLAVLLLAGEVQVGSAQVNQPSLMLYECDCGWNKVSLYLPPGYNTPRQTWYEEGFIWYISYPDQSYITLLCGANAKLSLPKPKKGLYQRQAVLAGHPILYARVPQDKVSLFNRFFDTFTDSR